MIKQIVLENMPISKVIRFDKLNMDVEFIVGKNAKENFEIIDYACEHHLWFHVKGCPSSHVIACIDDNIDRKDMRYIVKQGAVLCKQHSKYASAKNVEILYTRVCNVQKTDIMGSVSIEHEKTVVI
jgi:predicted ribosome quality control (RQC) complex YloA/Tae2 family protein